MPVGRVKKTAKDKQTYIRIPEWLWSELDRQRDQYHFSMNDIVVQILLGRVPPIPLPLQKKQ